MPSREGEDEEANSHMNRRAQVDCIDMQSNPDGEYRYIMEYLDHLTKWTVLRPLKTKKAEEIAENLVNIFCHFGSPVLLHSDNGREFVIPCGLIVR